MSGRYRIDVIGPAADPACRAIAAALRAPLVCHRFLDVEEFQATAAEAAGEGVIAVLTDEAGPLVWDLPRWLWQRGLVAPVVMVGPAVWAARAWEARPARFVAWPTDPHRVLAAVEEARFRFQPVRGLSHSLQRQAASLARLSAREREVLERIADGWWVKRIAAELGTSPCTVRAQRASILQKLEVNSPLEAALLVQSARWLEALQELHR